MQDEGVVDSPQILRVGRNDMQIPPPRNCRSQCSGSALSSPNIDVCHRVQVADGTGTDAGGLESLVLKDLPAGMLRRVPADACLSSLARSRGRSGSGTPSRATTWEAFAPA